MPDSLKVSRENHLDENRISQDHISNLQLSCNVLLHNHQSLQRDSENHNQDSDYGFCEVQTNLDSLNSPKNPPESTLESQKQFKQADRVLSKSHRSSKNSQRFENLLPVLPKTSNLSEGTKSSPNIENVPMSNFKAKHNLIYHQQPFVSADEDDYAQGPKSTEKLEFVRNDWMAQPEKIFDFAQRNYFKDSSNSTHAQMQTQLQNVFAVDYSESSVREGRSFTLDPNFKKANPLDEQRDLISFQAQDPKSYFNKSKAKFNRGMEFNYRFSRSAVAKRIQALHGYGLEAIFEDLDLENERTVLTNQSHEFSVRGFAERLEQSQLLRSQEEPQMDIEKLRSSMNSVLRESKEFPTIFPQSASPKKRLS